MAKAKEFSRWRLDEAARGETAIDSTGRIEFDFAAGDVKVEVGSPEEAVLARVLVLTGHAVPIDDPAKSIALLGPDAEPADPPAAPRKTRARKKAAADVVEQQPPDDTAEIVEETDDVSSDEKHDEES